MATNIPNRRIPEQESEESEITLRTYWDAVVTYWWIVVPLVVLGGAIGLTKSLMVKPRYQAFCRYEVYENEILNISDPSAAARAKADPRLTPTGISPLCPASIPMTRCGWLQEWLPERSDFPTETVNRDLNQ